MVIYSRVSEVVKWKITRIGSGTKNMEATQKRKKVTKKDNVTKIVDKKSYHHISDTKEYVLHINNHEINPPNYRQRIQNGIHITLRTISVNDTGIMKENTRV